MPLISTSRDEPPQLRLTGYRSHGVTHGILLVPWDALSRIQRDAALQLAAEWGRELADVETFRRDVAHADDVSRDRMIAGVWLVRLLDGPIHLLDAEHWTEMMDNADPGVDFDPRVAAFRDASLEAIREYDPPPPPGPKCRCPTCEAKYGKQKHRRR